jgi:uncharacterized protein
MRAPELQDRLDARKRPAGRPAMFQTWKRLCFLHWTVDPQAVRALVPDDLELDLWEGQAWVGVVPFAMRAIRPRGLPAVPGISNFLELNLRTYVHDAEGRPGVWFFSLDASQLLAVKVARWRFKLPYHHAAMREEREDDAAVFYRSHRRGTDRELCFRYRPQGPKRLAEPGSLEFFLVERYLLFARDPAAPRSRIGRVFHDPYEIQDAEAPLWDDGLFSLEGLPRPDREPDHVLFSEGVDVDVFGLE